MKILVIEVSRHIMEVLLKLHDITPMQLSKCNNKKDKPTPRSCLMAWNRVIESEGLAAT